ncbi:MAG: response regulator [Candidatus Methylacidiphilales bacterium]|nr:response regulator [Candidatus Methylacidiphilales bacterium]
MSTTQTSPSPTHRTASFQTPSLPVALTVPLSGDHGQSDTVLRDALTHQTGKVSTPVRDRYSPGIKVDWANLVDSTATLPFNITLDQVQQFYREHPTEKYAAVLDRDRIVGLCSELSISRKLTVSRGLGYHVYSKTSLERHLEPTFLTIQRGTPVRDVLFRVMSRTEGFFDDVILTDERGKYLGLIRTQTMMLLQHRISQQQVDDLESLTLKLSDNNIELERARDTAMQAAEMKSTFLANMSHEIRTPLNGILGMIKILMRTELVPQQRRYATTVLNSANALLTILNDILDFSKIEAGKMTFEQINFDLSDVVEECVQLLSERAREKKIQIFSWIDLQAKTRIVSDSSRLRQVILNLASNAVKFTENGEVVVRIDQEKESPTHVTLRVSVKDTGIGVTPEVRERLFRPFEQGDRATNRKFGGTGLGLAICKRIVEMLGGSIGCESELGKGSTFWFLIDLPKQADTDHLAARREEDLWGLRMLIVDSSTTFGSYLEQHMGRWKVVSRITHDSAHALDIARSQADRGTLFDAVIVDYHLEPMNGLELARHFQADPRLARSRFILLTSFENELSADTLAQAGVAGTLPKPLKPSELYDKLAESLRSQPENRHIVSAVESQVPKSVPVVLSTPTPIPAPEPRTREISPAAVPAPPALATTQQERACPPLNLLLVEDSEVNREVAIILLSSWGHTVETAENGRVAVTMLQDRTFDGILMDCQMPEMDGYEATKVIRDPSSRVLDHDVPIVAMTANAMPGDREICIRAGMNDYVGKPIDEGELLQSLFRVARNKTQRAGSATTAQPMTPAPNPVDSLESAFTRSVPSLAVAAPPMDSTPNVVTAGAPSDPVEEEDDDAPYFPARLMSLFLNETSSRLAELRESLQREDMIVVQRIAHTIKGTAGNFRAHRLYEITRQIEKLSRDHDIQAIWPLMGQAEETFQNVKTKYLQSVAYQPGETPS